MASGKCRNKIPAWVANKVSNLGQWEKVALFPASDFIAKNQLARKGSQNVSPVTIQRRQDLVSGTGPEVLPGSKQRPKRVSIPAFYFLQDIAQTSLHSFLGYLPYFVTNKQTNKPWTLSKLKRMTLGPLRPLRPFYGGVSVDQIMQACHWKAHTFTHFYLKNLLGQTTTCKFNK